MCSIAQVALGESALGENASATSHKLPWSHPQPIYMVRVAHSPPLEFWPKRLKQHSLFNMITVQEMQKKNFIVEKHDPQLVSKFISEHTLASYMFDHFSLQHMCLTKWFQDPCDIGYGYFIATWLYSIKCAHRKKQICFSHPPRPCRSPG